MRYPMIHQSQWLLPKSHVLVKMWRKVNLWVLLEGQQIGSTLWKREWRFLKKTETISTIKPQVFTKENKNTNSKRHMHFYVYCNIFQNNQDVEVAYVLTARCIYNIHIYGILHSNKKMDILSFTTYGWSGKVCQVNYVRQTKTNTVQFYLCEILKNEQNKTGTTHKKSDERNSCQRGEGQGRVKK